MAVGMLVMAGPCEAASEGAARLDGRVLGTGWLAPFVGLLLSIALLPIVTPRFWHRHFGKVVAFWSLCVIVPMLLTAGIDVALHELAHVLIADFFPFIILLTALFVVTGGIRVTGSLTGTPGSNVAALGAGTILAGWMGTTGASMLMIRLMIAANDRRVHKAHVFVFFIFLVSNIGGALSPLGDPPLFLGFLRGIDFFWPTVNLLMPTAVATFVLLGVFYAIDSVLFHRERWRALAVPATRERLKIEGGVNFVILTAIILTIMASGLVDLGIAFDVFGLRLDLDSLLRDLVLIGLTMAALRLTAPEIHDGNRFCWAPMLEVAKLFAGIFVTIIPALAILRSGSEGALAPLLANLSRDGQPVDVMYFWITGALSSFLDNAPTYLVFFSAAGGDPHHLMGPLASTLMAISAGAVFMGANTYIGNAPNLMVKSIVESQGIRMPSFFGYMGWSIVILVPTFTLITVMFF